ncbi:hypothetical protein HPP92_015270 [Vanilla planifolia]|uniref:Sugar phosphate transporter domain-containing protein n=1 Tax=Vanilla planifolia TaxID=51239 RepID=A0A835UVF7_VANPL|nr:hypothetical protein HPP92_015792 [Vanilla planifolia]KAG0475584.1 hypothetical protein HPP92_015270 [Vanilla planifolia]
MWKITPITIFFFMTLMPLLDPPGFLSFNWNFNNSITVFISALFGFLLQWSGALALGATSATSHVVLGQFKTCVIMMGGYLFFNSDPGMVSLCGAIVALSGMTVYTYLNLRSSHDSAAVNKQPSFLQKAKSTTDADESDAIMDPIMEAKLKEIA